MRKAQISIFLIIILVIMAGAGLWYVHTLTQDSTANARLQAQHDIRTNLQAYVESCIVRIAEPAIYTLALSAGSTTHDVRNTTYQGTWHRTICVPDRASRECSQLLILREDIELALSDHVEATINDCLNLSAYSQYTLTTATPHAQSSINRDDVTITLTYPISIEGEGVRQKAERYIARINIPLGQAYEHMNSIAAGEILQGGIETELWMQKNPGWHATKHKPYPFIIYNISTNVAPEQKTLSILFALEEPDSAGQRSFHDLAQTAHPCCINFYDNTIFSNVPAHLCTLAGLTTLSCPQPEKPVWTDTLCNGKPCRNCEKTYEYSTNANTGKKRLHGESWCSYESIVQSAYGEGGYSYVGSRHFKHYCYDGKEYTEECKDYREELCTEGTIPKGTTAGKGMIPHATCRDNRWRDCTQCKTQECCENRQYRDCDWSSWSETKNRCVPSVPPGLPFWEGTGLDVCNSANEERTCEGFSCPYKYVEATAINCYRQGDCGNYRNIADALTLEGYFESDFKDNVREQAYQKPGLNKNPVEIGRKGISLPLFSRETEQLHKEQAEQQVPFYLYLALLQSNFEQLSQISLTDFLPWNKRPSVEMQMMAYCGLWQAPQPAGSDNTCARCSAPGAICSEYRCRSLGSQCRYTQTNGFGACISAPPAQKTVTIDINREALTPGLEAIPATMTLKGKTLQGYRITPALEPYKPLSIGITTSEETRCRISYLPEGKYSSLIPLFEQKGYQRGHNITMLIHEAFVIPPKFKDTLGVSRLDEVIDWAENPTSKYLELKAEHEAMMTLYDTFTGRNSRAESDVYFYGTALPMITTYMTLYPLAAEGLRAVLRGLEEHRYYAFIQCQDQAGNTNKDFFFIETSIGERNQERAPALLAKQLEENVAAIANNAPVALYFDQPVQCRYDTRNTTFESMKGTLPCSVTSTAGNGVLLGSYACTGTIPAGTEVYARCRQKFDRPTTADIQITIGESRVLSNTSTYTVNVSEGTLLLHAQRAAQANNIHIQIPQGPLPLILYSEDPSICAFEMFTQENESISKGRLGPCTISTHKDYGIYACGSTITIDDQARRMEITCTDKETTQTLKEISITLMTHKAPGFPQHQISPASASTATSPYNLSIRFNSEPSEGTACSHSNNPSLGFVTMQRYGTDFWTIVNTPPGIITELIECRDPNGNYLFDKTQFLVS